MPIRIESTTSRLPPPITDFETDYRSISEIGARASTSPILPGILRMLHVCLRPDGIGITALREICADKFSQFASQLSLPAHR